jgi:hyaluronate lyase
MSWFVLDEAVVVLGSGINGAAGVDVHGTVENRCYPVGKTPVVSIDGTEARLEPGGAAATPAASVHVENLAGYVKLSSGKNSAKWQMVKTRRRASWSVINSQCDTDDVVRDFVNIRMDFGAGPEAGTYAYAILPNASSAQTTAFESSPPVAVLSHTTRSHVISVPSRSLVMGNFLTRMSKEMAGIKVSGAMCVAIHGHDRGTEIAISNPSHAVTRGSVVLSRIAATSVIHADQGVSVTSFSPLTISVDLSDMRGAAKRVMVR